MKSAASRKAASHTAALRQRAAAPIDPTSRAVIHASRYSIPALERFLDGISRRAKARNPQGKGAAIMAWAAEAKEKINTANWLRDRAAVVLSAAHDKDPSAIALLAAAVEITTNNVVLANSNWMPFFEQRTLGEQDYPVIIPEKAGMAQTLHTIGADGGNRTIQSQLNTVDATHIPLHMKATNWIEYPLVDPYYGSGVKELALAQFDVALDRATNLDSLLASYLLVTGANTRLVASFTTTGDDHLRDYYAPRGVNTANLPTGNLVTTAGNSATTKLDLDVFRAIIEYFTAWGDGVMEGSVEPVEVLIASSHINSFLSEVGFSTQSNPIVDQVFNGGHVVAFGGYNWLITGDNTIDPDQGMAYVRSNLPIGVAFDKPSLAKTITDETPALVVQNKGRVCEIYCEAFALPLHWRKRMLGVRYKTPA